MVAGDAGLDDTSTGKGGAAGGSAPGDDGCSCRLVGREAPIS